MLWSIKDLTLSPILPLSQIQIFLNNKYRIYRIILPITTKVSRENAFRIFDFIKIRTFLFTSFYQLIDGSKVGFSHGTAYLPAFRIAIWNEDSSEYRFLSDLECVRSFGYNDLRVACGLIKKLIGLKVHWKQVYTQKF